MKKLINLKSRWGNYSTFEKTFKDEDHFNNWYKLMSRKGNKIIGIENIN
jgi:hypothetical protein